MTRKHFIALAAAIAQIKDEADRTRVAHLTADVCAQANKEFSRSKFLEACGL